MSAMKHITRARQLMRLAGDELTLAVGQPDTPTDMDDLRRETTGIFDQLKKAEYPGGAAGSKKPKRRDDRKTRQ